MEGGQASTRRSVIITGNGSQQCVAVLFHHDSFPGVRFGHRFPLDPHGTGYEQIDLIWLKEAIETGELDRMMQSEPIPDDAGIMWTTWEG